jgi:hypothetical protein
MKQIVGSVGLLLLMVLFFSSAAMAIPWKWTDAYDADVFLSSSLDSFTFCHDIRDNGFRPLKDFVLNYKLRLEFKDDCDREKEFVFIDLPGLVTDGIFKIDSKDIERGWSLLGLAELNLDGNLRVTIDRGCGDFWFDESTLCAIGEKCSAPVPEPMSMILLGAGLLGLTGFRRRLRE